MRTLRQRGYGVSYATIQDAFDRAITGHEEFKSGAMTGERAGRYGVGSAGMMTGITLAAFHRDNDAYRIDYVVRSYATPIAWHTTDGMWVMPDDGYSVTTARHQGFVRRALRGTVSYRPTSDNTYAANVR